MWVALCPVLLAVVALLVSQTRWRTEPISVHFLSITNGTVGFTNATWQMFVVTNHTTRDYEFRGAKIMCKTARGWEVEPNLRAPESGGWIVPPTMLWREENPTNPFIALPAGGSFKLFLIHRDAGAQRSASLLFGEYQGPTMAAPLISGSDLAGYLEETIRDGKERLQHLTIECSVPVQ